MYDVLIPFLGHVQKKKELKIKQISSRLNLPIRGKVFELIVFDKIFCAKF